MDAAVAGALIGFSVIAAGCIGIRIYDLYQKRKQRRQEYIAIPGTTPVLIKPHTHWKMKHLFKSQPRILLTSIDSQKMV